MRPFLLRSTPILFCLALVGGGPHASAKDRREIEADKIFSSVVKAGEPGAAVLVIQNDRKVFERGYGVRDLNDMHANDARTNFRLASCTKQFTAMATMLLVHDGKLRYDETVTEIFPDFPAYGRKITIRNLLNHTSGLPDYEDLMSPVNVNVPDLQLQQIQDSGVLDLLEHQNKAKFAPGTHWDYSNSGYVLLGLVVAKVSGEPFGQFLHDRIFSLLGMKNTIAYERGKNEVAHRAFGHSKIDGIWKQTDQSATSATLGDGGVYSSLENLAKWDRALQRHTLLSEAEMRAALTPVVVPDSSVREPDGTPAEYGFGWFLNPYKGHHRMWHYGETMGFRTSIQRFPADKLTVIVLCNRTDVDAAQLALRVADLYLRP